MEEGKYVDFEVDADIMKLILTAKGQKLQEIQAWNAAQRALQVSCLLDLSTDEDCYVSIVYLDIRHTLEYVM